MSPAASVHLSPSHRSMREHRLRRTASLTYVIMCALSLAPSRRPHRPAPRFSGSVPPQEARFPHTGQRVRHGARYACEGSHA